ncbi:MAG: hypothetical protein IPK60_19585 [Sandaracinaceae bacterium]|nr:hypothetical protein [Sandaracinaceae bacterium]
MVRSVERHRLYSGSDNDAGVLDGGADAAMDADIADARTDAELDANIDEVQSAGQFAKTASTRVTSVIGIVRVGRLRAVRFFRVGQEARAERIAYATDTVPASRVKAGPRVWSTAASPARLRAAAVRRVASPRRLP